MKRRELLSLIGGTVAIWALFLVGAADASEVKVLASTAIKTALQVLAPQFENAANHKLFIVYGASARLQPEIEKGEAFDLAILSTAVTDALIKEGKLVRRDARRHRALGRRRRSPQGSTKARYQHHRILQASAARREIARLQRNGSERTISHGHVPTSRHRAGDEAKTQARAAKSTEPPGAGRRRDRHWNTADQRGSRVPRGRPRGPIAPGRPSLHGSSGHCRDKRAEPGRCQGPARVPGYAGRCFGAQGQRFGAGLRSIRAEVGHHFLTLKCRKSGGGWSFLIGIKLPSAPSIYWSLPMNTSLRSSVQLFSVHLTVGKRV